MADKTSNAISSGSDLRKNIPVVTVESFFHAHSEKLQLKLEGKRVGFHRKIREPTINRPGLALSGFYNYFAEKRIQVLGAATALFLLALYLAVLSRGVVTVLLAAGLLTLLLFVTFDLDRPTRGLITITDAPLVQLRASMELPPAANASNP